MFIKWLKLLLVLQSSEIEKHILLDTVVKSAHHFSGAKPLQLGPSPSLSLSFQDRTFRWGPSDFIYLTLSTLNASVFEFVALGHSQVLLTYLRNFFKN